MPDSSDPRPALRALLLKKSVMRGDFTSHYVVEARTGPPAMTPRRICPGCGLSKALNPGETMCPPCVERGAAPVPSGGPAAGSRSGYQPGPSERRMMAADTERARLAAGDVTNADDALRWLAEHATVTHEY